MIILDPGHKYKIPYVDGKGSLTITFTKRIRGKYPGILIQFLLRVIIDRLKFLNAQVPCKETSNCILLARKMLILLESRAARRKLERNEEIEYTEPNYKTDGHIFKINTKDTK